MKLLITGGHVTPALACIDEIKSKNLHVDIVFVGRKFPNNRDKSITFEYQEIQKRNIRFIDLQTGRVSRMIHIRTFMNLIAIPKGFWNSFMILLKEKPDAILSFGGYIALPVAVIGKLFGIKIYTHEQTIHPGIANRVIAHLAEKIFVSFPETVGYFARNKVIITGNPVRKSIFEVKTREFIDNHDRKVIYITGGSLGAHSINVMIEKILHRLLEKYTVIHQTGNMVEYNDLERLSKLHASLSEEMKHYYYPRAHFYDEEIGYIYKRTDLVVGRSGANTFFELASLKKPALFIPLPVSAHKEQQEHAYIFKQIGIGEVYEGEDPETLLALIEKMVLNLESYRSNFIHLPSMYAENAAEKIIESIYSS